MADYHWEATGNEPAASDDQGIRGFHHFQALARHPLGHALEPLRRAGKCRYHTDSGLYQKEALISNLPYGLLLLLGMVPALKSRRRWGAGLMPAIFLTAWTMSTLTIYIARYLMTGIVIASPITAIAPLWVVRELAQVAGTRHRVAAIFLDEFHTF